MVGRRDIYRPQASHLDGHRTTNAYDCNIGPTPDWSWTGAGSQFPRQAPKSDLTSGAASDSLPLLSPGRHGRRIERLEGHIVDPRLAQAG
jgi:hypothetical protein